MRKILYIVRHCQAVGQEHRIGYAEWEKLSNPDVYRVEFINSETNVERAIFF